MSIFDIFRPRPQTPAILGALPDLRTQEERAGDVHISEIVARSAALELKTLEPGQVRTFGDQNQGGKSDCVAETRRKVKRVMLKVNKGLDLDFSATAFYRRRANYPAPGMQWADAVAIDKEFGMTLDALVPSDAVRDEATANALRPELYNADIGKVFAIDEEVSFDPGDFETPAGTIQVSRKAVMAWFFFNYQEWARQVPVVLDPRLQWAGAATLRHSVSLIEPAIFQGQRGFWIDDSAQFGGFARRFVTEEFYRARNWVASYPIAFKFEKGVGARPRYTGTTTSAQECLRYEGLFPTNVDYVDVVGPLTRRALGGLQARYGLKQTQALDAATDALLRRAYP